MTFELRLTVVAFSTFALTAAVAAVPVRWWLRRLTMPDPVARGAALLRLRLGALALAVAATVVAATSFLLFEQRVQPESTGLMMQGMAVLTLLLWAGAVIRAIVLAVTTRRMIRTWMATAEPMAVPGVDVPTYAITTSFPVVAIAGILRPRLVIARSVIDACTPAELVAIVAHERRHLDAHDNLRRALIVITPDLLAWLPIARRLREAWNEAAEDAADDAAAAAGEEGRVDLAAALIRVARLREVGGPQPALPASALYRGENLDRRVRRLLEPAPATPEVRRSSWRRWTTYLAAGAACALVLEGVHVVIELGVTFLP